MASGAGQCHTLQLSNVLPSHKDHPETASRGPSCTQSSKLLAGLTSKEPLRLSCDFCRLTRCSSTAACTKSLLSRSLLAAYSAACIPYRRRLCSCMCSESQGGNMGSTCSTALLHLGINMLSYGCCCCNCLHCDSTTQIKLSVSAQQCQNPPRAQYCSSGRTLNLHVSPCPALHLVARRWLRTRQHTEHDCLTAYPTTPCLGPCQPWLGHTVGCWERFVLLRL
jgi:hypothetical protein